MKRLTLIALSLVLLPGCALAAKQKNEKGEIIKTGWNFGPLPVVGFDSDLGFQYGACMDMFNFGDGSTYPQYKFKINVEASTYTKGSSVLRCDGDFKNVIKDGKLFFDVTYFDSPKFGFYGFNGFASPYDPELIYPDPAICPADAKSGYNFMNRKQFRALVSIQKRITGDLNWAVGAAYYNIRTSDLNIDKFDSYQGQSTLYARYKTAGLIKEDEADGGNVLQFRAGLVYDTRNHDSDPTRGINIEAAVTASPDIIDRKGYSNVGFTFVGSQFVPLAADRLTLAYRIGLQSKIWGEIPYYFANNLNMMFFRKMYTEGLGGNASVRGINRNGVIGNGLAWANVELRWRFFDFKLINQNWGLALNPFFDAGQVISPYRLDTQKAMAPLYSGDKETPHCSAGLGIKLVMNHNMIVSFEAAKALSSNDGSKLWTNVGFNYVF